MMRINQKQISKLLFCLKFIKFEIQMNEADQSTQILQSMSQEVKFIGSNRAERNKRYDACMTTFKQFLNDQTQQFEQKELQNTANKELISKTFQNTFQRILASSDISIRKIKQTFNQKKLFWQNVIKMNSDISDIELKKQFYLQKRNAEDGYEEAIDRQKEKHKTYKSLVSNKEKKEQLRQYQQTNKLFEEKVVEGSNTLVQWQNLINNNQKYPSYSYQPEGRTVINQFVQRTKNTIEPFNLPPKNNYRQNEVQNSTLFLNNFQIRK